MKKYLQLAVQIVRSGTLRARGRNFRESRARGLEQLQEFVPQNGRSGTDTKANRGKQSSRNNLIAQLAFIRAAFKTKGGHISTSDLAYVRIPKSANTSISYAMLVKKYPSLAERNPDETQINFLTDVNLKPAPEIKSETIFTVVRNPFARLVSVYRDFFENKDTDFLYAGYLFGILTPEISFAEFVSRIGRIPDRLKDQHFRPQYLFIQPYEKSGHAVKWFKLEEPETLDQFLHEHHMELVHRNKSRGAYRYEQYYTPDLLKQVYTLYYSDIEKFGYGPHYVALQSRLHANLS